MIINILCYHTIMKMERAIRRIVVTGATSTVGVAVINEALEKGIEVLAICSQNCTKLDRLPQNSLLTIVECDISKYSTLNVNNTKKYDAFFHLAWLASINNFERNNLYPQAKNIEYALDSVNLAEKLGCTIYIGAGSQAEYGKQMDIINEETQPLPDTAYGIAKLCAGQMTRLACKKKNIEHIWPRIFSVYGPCCADSTVVQHTIKELLLGESPELSGGDQIWDFLYLKDAGDALLRLALYGKNGETYCVASGKSKKLKDYLSIIQKIINPNIELVFGKIPYNENTVMFLQADIQKLRHDTGFIPKYTFEDGIKETINWNLEEKEKEQKNE